MSKFKAFLALLTTVVVLVFSSRAEASHFRYGNIRYTVPDPVSAARTVRFEIVAAWRFDMPDEMRLDFGDGTASGSLTGLFIGDGTDASTPTPEQYKVYRYTATHTYPTAGQYVASFADCCRISTLQNAANQSFKVEAVVDLTPGNTGNPATVVPAIVQMQTGGLRTILIPAVDPDQTLITCRFATPAETGSTMTVMPPIIAGSGVSPSVTVSSSPPGCTLTWNTVNATAGQKYAVQVRLESANPMNGNIGSAVVDFIIEMVGSPLPTCTGSGSYTVDMGQTLNTSFIGTNFGGGDLKMTSIGSVGLLSPTSGTTRTSPFTTNFTWSPGLGDDGTNILAVVYKNALNISGYCTLTVTVPDCPVFNQPCTAGVGACESSGRRQCNGPNVECTAVAKMPMPEICNGLDDDCNGTNDDNNPEAGQTCASTNLAICKPGMTSCTAGVLECISNIEPGSLPETCNSVDDDCNGVVDDGFNVGGMCSIGIGGCLENGTYECDGMGGVMCNATIEGPKPERCDGIDNDCNGFVDDGLGLGILCLSGMGECAANGLTVCDNLGNVVCSGVPGTPVPEVCGDNKDNDCNGSVDNGCGDADGDGILDGLEERLGSNPNDTDSDDDGLLDGDEVSFDTDSDGDGVINILDTDSDNDGLFDGTEMGKTCTNPDTNVLVGHCRPDADAGQTTTDPLNPDSDGDDKRDGSEDSNLNGRVDMSEGNPNDVADAMLTKDFDGDGLGDRLEEFLGANTNDADSDDDGLLDGDEDNPSDDTDQDGVVNVLDVDSDSDALFDGTEAGKSCQHPATNPVVQRCQKDLDAGQTKTSTLLKDSDGGGATDASEDANLNGVIDPMELDPQDPSDDANVIDTDGDGLGDGLERTLNTKVNDADSDNDGLLDGEEPDPTVDTDGDGLPNIVDADSDNDLLFDGTEAGSICDNPATDLAAMKCIADADAGQTKTRILDADTDDGSKIDGHEDLNRNGRVDANETNPLFGADDLGLYECLEDSDCGNVTSGRVCANHSCVDGCRGIEGNGCPGILVCSSVTKNVGTCGEAEPPPTTNPPETNCSCRIVASNDSSPFGYGLSLGAVVLLGLRRRRSTTPP
ncbi:MAG TPA: MopE-related protein [Polyangium sp.]|nr:MopE-related protein [Polyangium sp.]